MDFEYEIPLIYGSTMRLTLKAGTSAAFLGPNGSGKSRLGTYFELETEYSKVTHRVGAQRALQIPSEVTFKDMETALHALWYGNERHTNKMQRWLHKPSTLLLSDYDRLLTVLFSEELSTAMSYKDKQASDPTAQWPSTRFAKVKDIWDNTIITRSLSITKTSLHVKIPDTDDEYAADGMSDGERVLFYLAGQCLLAPPNGVIIIDEPELHLHTLILHRAWDQIEAARPDCLFIYLTHNIDFAISRTSGQKYTIGHYNNKSRWDITPIPSRTTYPEDIAARILGARKPILFVEGTYQSKDVRILANIYDDHAILPVGSCEHVIHLTNSFNAKTELHYLTCRGIIDKDNRTNNQIKCLKKRNIYVIDFAEIENLLLAEPVLQEVGKFMGFEGDLLTQRVNNVKEKIVNFAKQDIEIACIEYTKDAITRTLSSIGFQQKINNRIV